MTTLFLSSPFNFFEYLQNQPSLNIVQQLQYADAESSSISTMVLTILLLLSTVEGVVLFFSTLYSWCLFPLNVEEERGEGSRRRRRRRRRRRGGAGPNGGEHHLFWWLEMDYDSENDDYYSDIYGDGRGAEDDDDEDDDDDSISTSSSVEEEDDDDNVLDYHTHQDQPRRKMSRSQRIEMSLQEQKYDGNQFEDCCAICLVDFEYNDRVVSGTTKCCRSCFHRQCLEQWLKIRKTCPCCRSNVLLKSRDLIKRKQQEEASSRDDGEPSDDRMDTESTNPSNDAATTSTHETETEASDDTMTLQDWTSELVPELDTVDSVWPQFWFLIF
mmetsp:Transcript_25512/g.44942  ORF Transcript_25512/g.44942 Transcript_25512/m.44942 type:complete len:328 (-) Transcript_25512:778-1761(-)